MIHKILRNSIFTITIDKIENIMSEISKLVLNHVRRQEL